ncbi:DUF4957 domain-containing protein [Sphingobacterium haloxyli]|uniref:Fibronectin type-III domain-containing protein n=1 Tax=Sphingobacterium haloxyli TaxID=2100533 RepID=A0A2S9J959_9SPHI|nr:DUF4957 domain-containing protein [Sphingobacterium haloxyli]PRD49300.1 hypothetical protein C5745_01365 [Sphingobacterium haloxyli]
MKNKSIRLIGIICAVCTMISACKKDPHEVAHEPLTEAPAAVNYVVQGANIQINWTKPAEDFDYYTLELSKVENFSVLDRQEQVDADHESIILRNMDLAENYYVRIRTARSSPESFSDWANLVVVTNPSDILLPIKRADIDGSRVNVSWVFPQAENETADKITHIVLVPTFGLPREISLSDADKDAQKLTISELDQDMEYEIRIFNGSFLRGRQLFTTPASSINGVWTLSPHSDLKDAVERSINGDEILLNPGIYDSWDEEMYIGNKSITIKAADESVGATVYVKGFVLTGGGNTRLQFVGLDFSGARINRYKQEIPNTPDSRWNSWLVEMADDAADFDVVSFEDCTIRNYYTGLLNMQSGQVGSLVSIDNTIVRAMGNDGLHPFINVGAARIKKGMFTNSTFSNTNKLFIDVDREKNPENDIDFLFKNNTVDNSWSASAFDFKASKLPTKVRLENNIFSNIQCAANFFNNFAHVANDFDKRLINCNFFNVTSKSTIYGSNSSNMPVHNWELRHPNNKWNEVVPAFEMNDESHENPNSIREYPMAFDPEYVNAENGDFTIGQDSELRLVAAGTPIGDPRWW